MSRLVASEVVSVIIPKGERKVREETVLSSFFFHFFSFLGGKELKGKAVVFLETGVVVSEKAMLGAGCIIGAGRKDRRVCVEPCLHLQFLGSSLEERCSVKKTTLGRHNRVATSVKIQTSITMNHVTIGEG